MAGSRDHSSPLEDTNSPFFHSFLAINDFCSVNHQYVFSLASPGMH